MLLSVTRCDDLDNKMQITDNHLTLMQENCKLMEEKKGSPFSVAFNFDLIKFL